MKQKYYQKTTETMNPNKILKLQSKKLRKQIKYVYENVPYYRNLMKKHNINPQNIKGIQDLSKLPFLSKNDLNNAYPLDLVATPLENCIRIHSTSGTTGRRVIAFYTKKDLNILEECCARAIVATGGSSKDICQISYGYGLFTGGLGIDGGARRVGCLTLPMSYGNTERQIQFMNDLGSTILCCTPSYASYMYEEMKNQGYNPKDIPLKIGIFGAEPWTEQMRDDIEKKLDIKAYDIYGLTEIIGPGVAFECSEQSGMHINEDHFLVEVINPDTNEILPEGTVGELVITCLDKEAFPLIRYRTHDICKIFHQKCSCGRTLIKMSKPIGRTDEMLIIRGINIFPSQIETVLMKEGYNSNYQIIVDRVNSTDTIEINIEIPNEIFLNNSNEIPNMKKKLTNAMKNMLGISPQICFMEEKSIERNDGKAIRVIDKRKI